MPLYYAYAINWDVDYDVDPSDVDPSDLNLPWDAIVRADTPDDIPDALSDDYGFCVLDCRYRGYENAPDSMSLAKAEQEDRLTEEG